MTQQKDISTFKTFKRLWPTIQPYSWVLVGGGVMLILNALIDSGLIYLLKPLLDEGFGEADHDFLKLMAVVVVVFIFSAGLPIIFPLTPFPGCPAMW